MTATPGEFANSLRAAFPGEVAEGDGWFAVAHGAVTLRFDYVIETPLRIGILELPRMQVTVTVAAGDPEAASAMLEAVDRASQRGGG